MVIMTFKNNDFGDVLLNRASVRNFDPSVKIPREELRQMIEETIPRLLAVTCRPGILSWLTMKPAKTNYGNIL